MVAVADFVPEAARKVADQYGAKFYATGEELIAAPEVDAVLVTSADPSHAGYVLECLKHNKYVFCEKPLAQTASDCEKIMQAELACGKRLVQVLSLIHISIPCLEPFFVLVMIFLSVLIFVLGFC